MERKAHKNNENWQMVNEQKKVVCKTARRAHSQKMVNPKKVANDLIWQVFSLHPQIYKSFFFENILYKSRNQAKVIQRV